MFLTSVAATGWTHAMRKPEVYGRYLSAAGGCLCGSVRYEIEGDVLFAGFCYCRDCRKVSGAGRVPFVGCPAEAVQISGVVRTFSSRGGSGQPIERGFCPSCGARLCARPAAAKGVVIVYAGTLDVASSFHPEIGIHVAQRVEWEYLPEELRLFENDVPA